MPFKVGDLVWAKMKGYPPWPAEVSLPDSTMKVPKGKQPKTFVVFFGTGDCAFIPNEDIFLHTEEILSTYGNKKSKVFQKAVKELLQKISPEIEEEAEPESNDKPSSGTASRRRKTIDESSEGENQLCLPGCSYDGTGSYENMNVPDENPSSSVSIFYFLFVAIVVIVIILLIFSYLMH